MHGRYIAIYFYFLHQKIMKMVPCFVILLLFLLFGGAHQCMCTSTTSRQASPRVSPAEDQNFIHHYAIQRVTKDDFITGVTAGFPMWKPNLSGNECAQTYQVWIVHENYCQVFTDNALEAGWMVDEERYGDSDLHFFVKATINGYQTSCYNEDPCEPKFYKEQKNLFDPITDLPNCYGNHLSKNYLSIQRDEKLRQWVVKINNEKVGFWKMDAFPLLKDRLPNAVEMGGKFVEHRRLGSLSPTATNDSLLVAFR